MVKAELIKAVAEKAGSTQAKAEEIIDFIRKTMVDELIVTARFVYPDLGIFTLKTRPARTGRNPQTGEAVEIAAKKKVAFKMSSELKRQVNR